MGTEFQVGDVVIKPSIGVCRITERKAVEVDGASKEFFVFAAGEVKVMVPVVNATRTGLRCPISREEADRLLNTLRRPLLFESRDQEKEVYRLHPRDVKEGIRRRDPHELVELVRAYFNKSKDFHLERKEREFFDQLVDMLAEELSFALSEERLAMNAKIKNLMDEGREEKRRMLLDCPGQES